MKGVHCPTLLNGTVSCHYIPTDKSYYKINIIFGRAIPFSTSRGKMEGCERCTLSPSIDGHWSHLYLSGDESYYKKKLILDMQFPFLSRGKMEGCECTLSPFY